MKRRLRSVVPALAPALAAAVALSACDDPDAPAQNPGIGTASDGQDVPATSTGGDPSTGGSESSTTPEQPDSSTTGDATGSLGCPDSDRDTICDADDTCPGGNDNLDSDSDLICDFFDTCPGGVDTLDTDQDNVCDFLDTCPGGDDDLDFDKDGVCDHFDVCPWVQDVPDRDGGPTSCVPLVNPGFESYTASDGASCPCNPPDSWSWWPLEYASFGTQAHGGSIYNPADPSDSSNAFPGHNESRALKAWGLNPSGPTTTTAGSNSSIYQEWLDSSIPTGSALEVSGWAYISSVEPMGANAEAFLFIRCFDASYSQDYCEDTVSAGMGASRDTNSWTLLVARTEVPEQATIVQAGVGFRQCPGGPGDSCTDAGGSVYWDDIYFSYTP